MADSVGSTSPHTISVSVAGSVPCRQKGSEQGGCAQGRSPRGRDEKQLVLTPSSSVDTRSISRDRVAAAAALAAVAAFLVYLPALTNGFVTWDDRAYLADNPGMSMSGLSFLLWALTAFHEMTWQPLTWISHRFDFMMWGLSPRGHHFSNILIHTINSALVAVLSSILFKTAVRENSSARTAGSRAGISRETQSLWIAAIAGLLFAVHPIHVESVAWIAERKGLLCAFFYLLAVIVHLSSQRSRGAIRYAADRSAEPGALSLAQIGPALCAFLMLCAIASKPLAVSLPFVLLVLDIYPLRRLRRVSVARIWSLIREKMLMFGLAFASMSLAMIAHASAGGLYSLEARSLDVRVLVAAQSTVSYLAKMLLPFELSPFYAFPENVSLSEPRYIFAIALLSTALIACVWTVRRSPVWLSAAAVYLLLLAPVLGIVGFGRHAMADRFAYLPSIVVFILVAVGATQLVNRCLAQGFPRRKTLLAASAAGVALCLGLSARTWAQIGVWKDDLSLWTAVVISNPDNSHVAFAHLNLGSALAKAGRYEDALRHYRHCLRLNPSEGRAYHNIGNALAAMGKLEEALSAYGEALRLDVKNVDARVNRGNVLSMLGRKDEAEAQFRIALKQDPQHAKGLFNLGLLYEERGDRNAAIKSYRAALRSEPRYSKAWSRLKQLLRSRSGSSSPPVDPGDG